MLVSTVSFAQHERYQGQESRRQDSRYDSRQESQQYEKPAYEKPAYQEPKAGNEGYKEIETVENTLTSEDADTSQIDNFKGSNEASNTEGSPQINIYNANSNANKQKAMSESVAEGESKVDAYANSTVDSSGNHASDIKNARKGLEYKTDEKVIEKLEWSRIEDEKDRADRLFGHRLDKNYDKKYDNDYKQEDKYEKPAVVVVEKPVYEAPYKKTEEVYEKNEVSTDYDNSLFGQQTYISPLLGTMSIDSDNVKSDMAVGVAFGTRFATNFSVEGSFLYSDITMDNAYEVIDGKTYAAFKSGEQYGFGLGVAYHFMGLGRLVPKIGGILGYTYRELDQTRFGNQSASSTAVDAGIGIGADMMISKNVSIGAEYRWMTNVSYSRDNSELDEAGFRANNNRYGHNNRYGNRSSSTSDTALEEAGYQMFLVNGKFNF